MDGLQLHELGTIVSEAFQRILCVTDLAKWLESRVLASEAERFQLWSHSLRLQHEGHASLDYRVRDSVIVRDRLAQLLQQLADHLEELFSITSGERKPAEETYDPLEDDSSCSSSSGGSSSNGNQSFPNLSNDEVSFHEVDYRLHSVSDRLDALYSLATRIRNPANRPSRTTDQLYKYIPSDIRAAHIAEREDAEISIVRYVVRQDMLQSLDSQVSEASKDSSLLHDISPASWLIRRIGIANARRKQQFIYWKDHTIRLSQHKRETTGTAVNTSMQHSMKEPQVGALPASIPRKPIAPSLATSATKLPALKPDDLKSVISHQSRVSTIFVTQGKGKLNWPPPPKPTDGKPYFECPYCKTICPTRYLKEGAWQAHLIHDLQPYTCTYEYCHDPNRLYGSKQEWINHESQHNRVWYCQEHNIEFETQPEYVSHVVNNHSGTKPEELSKELISAAMGPSTQIHRNCPLCAASFIDILAMQNHLMFHLERLALLALTPASEENDVSVQESDSHQAQLLGRLESLMRDFGSHDGSIKLPIYHIQIGEWIFKMSTKRPKSGLVELFMFTSPEELTIIYYFRSFLEDYIMEYPLFQVEDLVLQGNSQLSISLSEPPSFYIRKHDSTDIRQCEDFTENRQASLCQVHLINSFPGAITIYGDRLLELMQAVNRPEQQAPTIETYVNKWKLALQSMESADPFSMIGHWIDDVVEYPESAETQEVSEKDDAIATRELSTWETEWEHDLARIVVETRLNDTRIIALQANQIIPSLTSLLRPDSKCAICHAGADTRCNCEFETMEGNAMLAQHRAMGRTYSDVGTQDVQDLVVPTETIVLRVEHLPDGLLYLHLSAGRAHGVSEGAEFAIYTPNETFTSVMDHNQPLAICIVNKVEAFASQGIAYIDRVDIVGAAKDPVLIRCKAVQRQVILENYVVAPRTAKVLLPDEADEQIQSVQALERKIRSECNIVKLTDSGSPFFEIRRNSSGCFSIAFVHNDKTRSRATVEVQSEDDLMTYLAHLSIYYNLLNLGGSSRYIALTVETVGYLPGVAYEPGPTNPASDSPPKEPGLNILINSELQDIHDGDRFEMRVWNRSTGPVYIQILDLVSSWQASRLHPGDNSFALEPLLPGNYIKVYMRIRTPAPVPNSVQPETFDALIVFASTNPRLKFPRKILPQLDQASSWKTSPLRESGYWHGASLGNEPGPWFIQRVDFHMVRGFDIG